MTDAFRDYSSLIAGLTAADNEKTNQAITVAQTKAGIDSTTKILGETKLFLSGKPALQKIGKNIIKPALDNYKQSAKDFLEQKLKAKADSLIKKPGPIDDDVSDPTTTTATTRPAETEVDDLESPEDLQSRLLGQQGLRENMSSRINRLKGEAQTRSKDVEELKAKGSGRAEEFEKRVKTGDADGEELTMEARNGSAIAEASGFEGQPKTLADWRGRSDVTDGFSKQKTSFNDDDLGDPTGERNYNRDTGMTDEEQSQVDDLTKQGLSPEGAFGDSKAGTQSEANEIKPPTEAPKPKGGGGEEEDDAGDLGDLGAEEGATSILDAIPGLDILGSVGGAVLAGIMAHKEKVQVAAESAVQNTGMNVDTQIGVGGDEALN